MKIERDLVRRGKREKAKGVIMLLKGSFEFDRDVESIAVNRWAHGYAYRGSALSSYIHVVIDQA